MTQIKFYRVSQLPATGEIGGIYFLAGNTPTLYVYTQNGWENYASGGEGTSVDLAGYALTSWVTEQLNKIWNYLEWDSNAESGSEGLPNIITEVEIPTLNTNDKTVAGSINELHELINTYISNNYTTIEVNVSVLKGGSPNIFVGTEVIMTDLTSGHQESTILNDNNYCSFLVNKGHRYKIELEKIQDYYRVVTDKVKIADGSLQQYLIEVEYCTDDRFIVLSNGRLFTWQDYNDAGGFPSNLTPVLLYMNNSVLEQNNGSFYLPIQLMKSKLPSSANWGGTDSEDIPELANATSSSSNTGEYDMERNTNIIVDRYNTNCAAYIATQQVITINGVNVSGWLGTAEQYAQLLANDSNLQGWFRILGINTSYLTGLVCWTSSEQARASYDEVIARIVVNGTLNTSPKQRSTTAISILPFYKNIH